MWNKLVEIMQDPSYKRLGLAVILSGILHTLLFGGFNMTLPSLKKEMHVIEARIQMPKAVPALKEPLAVIEPAEPEPKPQALAEPDPIEEVPTKPPVNSELAKTVPEPIRSEPLDIPSKSIDISDSLPTPSGEPQPTPQPTDVGFVINENAYQYVETEFDVRTEIDGSTQGNAIITFDSVPNEQYQIKWLTQPSGVAALFIGDLLQTSEGELTKAGLRPKQYIYQFGNKADKARSAIFDWQAKKVTLQTSKGLKTEDLAEGAQDLLSFMYQFMYVAPLQAMQIAITNGKKMRVYDYAFAGEENVNSALGELKTVHIVHTGSGDEDKTELWLAIDYQFVPVKIRKTEAEGKVYELLATRINTNRPVVNH